MELDGRSKENMEQLYRGIRQILAKDGTFHVKKRTRNGYLENIIINATNITKVECIKKQVFYNVRGASERNRSI